MKFEKDQNTFSMLLAIKINIPISSGSYKLTANSIGLNSCLLSRNIAEIMLK